MKPITLYFIFIILLTLQIMPVIIFAEGSKTNHSKYLTPYNQKKDTCYYYLSGKGMTSSLTILDIIPFDCQSKYDTIGKILNQKLKAKYPDTYYQLENRKINGPFKSLKEANNAIIEEIKNFNHHKNL